jgi:hypothetical protein
MITLVYDTQDAIDIYIRHAFVCVYWSDTVHNYLTANFREVTSLIFAVLILSNLDALFWVSVNFAAKKVAHVYLETSVSPDLLINILSRDWVTVDGVLDLWPDLLDSFTYSAWLHFTFYCYTHTRVHSQVFTIRCSVAASNGGRSTSSGFQNCPRPQLPASYSNSSQGLNPSAVSSLTNTVTYQPTNSTDWTNSPASIAQKTPLLYYSLRPVV